MKLTEAIQVFDHLVATECGMISVDGEDIGVPYCCRVPVVQDSTSGNMRICCRQCGRAVEHIGRQWYVAAWGSRGIKMSLTPIHVEPYGPDDIDIAGRDPSAEFRKVARVANLAGLSGYELEAAELGADPRGRLAGAFEDDVAKKMSVRVRLTYRKAAVSRG